MKALEGGTPLNFNVVVASVATVAGIPALVCATYLAALSFGAFHRRRPEAPVAPHLRLAVVVPAHDEAERIGRVVRSLREQTYPTSLTRLVVIADNCDDGTAAAAADAGAEVMERHDRVLIGKGHALRWAFDRLLASDAGLDAVVVIDADSVADRNLLSELAAAAESAVVVQGDYQVLDEGGSRSAVRAAAFLLFHRARFQGRATFGMGCALVGNGMLLRRSVFERVPWNATSSAEDLEFTVNLRLAGIVPRYARSAKVRAPATTAGRAGAVQRMRWEGGRFHVMRTGLPRLIGTAFAHQEPSLLDMAIDLATPPLGLLVLASLVGGAVTSALVLVGVAAAWSLAVWLGALALIAVHVIVGLVAAGAPPRTYLALLAAPWFLVLKLSTYARLSRGTRADRWERTPRDPVVHLTGRPVRGGRVQLSGVPIDDVDRHGAVSAILHAIDRGSFLQVCTVNLHFMVTARRRADVRQVLTTSSLNVADGTPVVWLGRRLGASLPERVAGADLVTDLMSQASHDSRRVFLLGGTGGAAAAAAENLRRAYPGIVIAGTYEPPMASLETLESPTIVEHVQQARPDILLVGLGHPKQDLWIHRNRDRLPAAVAIGVGCTFDLLAQRTRRAPIWMQDRGLEWLYRLAQTPGRLLWRYSLCAVWFAAVFARTETLNAVRRFG